LYTRAGNFDPLTHEWGDPARPGYVLFLTGQTVKLLKNDNLKGKSQSV
jgi:hypothetical protein